MRPLVVVVMAAAVAAATPGAARAHKMEVEAAVSPDDPGRVRVVVGYEGDEASDGATVTLTDAAGAELARGTTDATGLCHLPRPPAGAYTVTADDGGGHREAIAFTVPESEQEVTAARSARRNRGVMSVVGVGMIAGLTVLAKRARRRTSPTH